MNKTSSIKEEPERKPLQSGTKIMYGSSSTHDLSNEKMLQQSSFPYLKDSKIKDVQNPDCYRRPTSHLENLENPNISQGYKSASRGDYSFSKTRPVDPRYAEFNRRKYQSLDDHPYYSDRERSRPPSRSSLDERAEDYRFHPEGGAFYPPVDERKRGQSEYARPPSRMSESDLNRSDRHSQYDYYKQQYPYNGPYERRQDYYQRPSDYRGKHFKMFHVEKH